MAARTLSTISPGVSLAPCAVRYPRIRVCSSVMGEIVARTRARARRTRVVRVPQARFLRRRSTAERDSKDSRRSAAIRPGSEADLLAEGGRKLGLARGLHTALARLPIIRDHRGKMTREPERI